jgi:Fe-S cluster assembly iron-binding protein IscA
MLKITKAAVQRLKTTLHEVAEAPDDCLRIVVTDEGPELIVDQQRPEDHTLEREERLLLVIDPETMDHFAGRVLEVDEATSLLVLS